MIEPTTKIGELFSRIERSRILMLTNCTQVNESEKGHNLEATQSEQLFRSYHFQAWDVDRLK